MRTDHTSGIAIAIDDPSQVGEARRTATAIAATAGLTETETGRLAIIASEAATNIVRHAARGELVLRAIVSGERASVDLIAIDAGPGIPDLTRALRDGYSTGGTSGTGLGAISRLATAFDIFTAPGRGTVLAARIEGDPRGAAGPKPAFDIGVVRVAKQGEAECGDDWGITCHDGKRATLAVADGIGHGPAAAEASRRAVEVARDHASEQPAAGLAAVHAALRPTRGAAVAIAELDQANATVRFAGVGNISACIVGQHDSRSAISHNGIAGHEARKIQEFSYIWPAGSLVILHSDGLSARWELGAYPGLQSHHPSVVAGVLYRDFSRRRDDALIVVVRAAA